MVDIYQVLKDRNPALADKLQPWGRFVLRAVTREKKLNRLLQKFEKLEPGDFCREILNEVGLKVSYRGIENLKKTENPVVCANHPMGGPEGLALIGCLWDKFGSLRVPANELLGILPPLKPIVIPVDANNPQRTHLDQLKKSFEEPSPMLFFPAGVTARMRGKKLKEYPWRSGFVTLSRKANRSIVPVRITGRNSWHFYTLHKVRKLLGISFNLEMSLLVDELFRQRGKSITCTFLTPVTLRTSKDGIGSLRDYDRELTSNLSYLCGSSYD
ncbi:MAG: hypothetical protein GW949_03335 [Spirochaetales bacterium]|nr:hypothetical protein [Spirochaetales bacterium]